MFLGRLCTVMPCAESGKSANWTTKGHVVSPIKDGNFGKMNRTRAHGAITSTPSAAANGHTKADGRVGAMRGFVLKSPSLIGDAA